MAATLSLRDAAFALQRTIGTSFRECFSRTQDMAPLMINDVCDLYGYGQF